MADDKSTWEDTVLPVVLEWAEKRFARNSECEWLIQDAISVSWQFHQTAGPDIDPKSIAWYAIKRVTSARRFGESSRSIDGPYRGKRSMRNDSFELDDLIREGDDPAEQAAFRLDFNAWVGSLQAKQRQAMERLALGDRTSEVAKAINVTPGRVSQLRQELAASYSKFE